MAISRIKTTAAALVAALGLGVAGAAQAETILVDFMGHLNDPTSPDTNGNHWNGGVGLGLTGSLLNTGGVATSVGINVTGDVDTSSTSDHWQDRTQSPDWSVPLALNDRLFMGPNEEEGSIVISGLDSNLSYNIELAASYGTGDFGSDPGFYNLIDANGVDGDGKGVTGYNAYTNTELTFNASEGGYAWTARATNGGEEGWLGWYNATPDANGELTLQLFASDESNSRVALNAMQIEVVPEPGSLALLGLGGLMMLGRRRRAGA